MSRISYRHAVFLFFFLLGTLWFAVESQDTLNQQEGVSELTPHFQIQFLELAFSNGKYYQVTGLKNPPPTYYLKIKALGSGILKGKWLLDQQPIGLWEVVLKPGQITDLRGRDVRPLPLKDTGMHKLTIEFSNYSFNRQLPTLRYFVAESGAIRIKFPEPGSKVPSTDSFGLSWQFNPQLDELSYQILISEIPLQFLTDEQMVWHPVGNTDNYRPDLTTFKAGTWIYWQVRAVNSSGRVTTTSEIASFKLIK